MDVLSAFSGMPQSENLANIGIMRFWTSVGQKFEAAGAKSPILLLEAHEPISQRVRNLADAGFEVQRDKTVQILETRGFGELAAVMRIEKPHRVRV